MRRTHIKPILTLTLITPFLTEVLTTNMSVMTMLRPRVLIAMMTIGYGFAVLLLREQAVRMRAGAISILLLGLIYGIYNEGIIAKTFLRVHGVPINSFDSYGLYEGMETGWAIAISTWHAFFAFLFPIVIVYSLFPEEREEPWLGRIAFMVLAAVTLALSCVVFLGKSDKNISGTGKQYLALAAVAAFLYLLAKRYYRLAPIVPMRSHSFTPAVRGFCMHLAIILIPALLAAARIPIIFYFVYFALLAWLALRRVSVKSTIALGDLRTFAFGGQIAVALFALLVAFKNHIAESVVSSCLFIVGLAYLLFRQTRGLGKTAVTNDQRISERDR